MLAEYHSTLKVIKIGAHMCLNFRWGPSI